MDRSLRQGPAIALLAAGCVFSASSHAYSAAEDAEAQGREVKAAYDRGYKAAKEELAREAATKQGASADTPPTTAASAQRSTTAPASKPILDIKHVYSDASDVETVQEVPVTAKPLPEQQSAQNPASSDARAAPPQSMARRFAATAAAPSTDPEPLRNQQPVRRIDAQVGDASPGRAAARVVQQDAAPPEEVADDEGDDAGTPRAAQIYATEPQYVRPRAQYAPPPVSMRPPPQPYGYVQQPTYVATRPYAYYAPPARWVDGYQAAPQAGRWYWSPEYGRWLYY
jgi:hypothetical protein